MPCGDITMEASDLHVPDIPLASCDEEEIDNNNKNIKKQIMEAKYCEEEKLNDDFSGSLEDLVGNFEEKITACLKDPEVTTADIAPVQVRTHDEVMKESQTWWTLTGNFGNMQPLDFGNSTICKKMAAALDSDSPKDSSRQSDNMNGRDDESDEDLLRQQMDVHQLIGQHEFVDGGGETPPQTADQVIEEIDEMLQSCDFTGSMMTDRTMESVDSMYSSMRSPFASSVSSEADVKMKTAQAIVSNPDNLQELPYSKLVTLCSEIEQLISVYNESLVEELAHRDELDYEKEMKNSLISLLLAVQNKRRIFISDKKRKGSKIDSSQLPQYVTATIPYNENQHIDNTAISSLIKILKAIHDDSPTVPSLLTDYILTFVCPKSVNC